VAPEIHLGVRSTAPLADHRAHVADRRQPPTIQELQAHGCESLRAIAAGLEERGIPAARGAGGPDLAIAGGGCHPFDASASAGA
jgi:hypothetical protein